MITTTPGEFGLDNLTRVVLSAPNQILMDTAAKQIQAPKVLAQRLLMEWRSLFCLEQIAPYRIKILFCDFHTPNCLRAVVALKVPVPLEPNSFGQLRRADAAVLGLTWHTDIMRMSVPSSSLVEILEPVSGVYHPNVRMKAPDRGLTDSARCCLGVIPIGMPLTEAIVLTHTLLAMKHTVNVRDPAGLLNIEAGQFFQDNPALLPLSQEPFILRETQP